MRNLLKKLTQKSVAVLTAAVVAGALIATPTVSAYTGTYTGGGKPQFNIYKDVQGVGDESDFVRIGAKGAAASQFTNSREVCEGEADLWVYIHNGAPEGYNTAAQNYSGIAKDTKLKVQIPSASGNIAGTISASNAASVTDTAKIFCDSSEVSVKYVAGTAEAWTQKAGTMKLNDSVVTTGAPIGTNALDGKVPGCWEFRVWVKLTVKVEKKEVPVEEPSTAVCKDITKDVSSRTVRVTVEGKTENATILGYKIDFGDGTVVTEKTASHTYAKDGKFVITGWINVKYADGTTKWISSDDCKAVVTFKTPEEPEQPEEPETPVTPEVPTEMPKTGAAGAIAMFTGVSAAGAAAHRYFTSRRFNK